MRFNDDTRTRLLIDVTASINPTGAAAEVKVDTAWYPTTWLSTPVQVGASWTQTARTVGYFAGPAVTLPAGAVVLSVGRHLTETRLTTAGGDILAASSDPVDVVA